MVMPSSCMLLKRKPTAVLQHVTQRHINRLQLASVRACINSNISNEENRCSKCSLLQSSVGGNGCKFSSQRSWILCNNSYRRMSSSYTELHKTVGWIQTNTPACLYPSLRWIQTHRNIWTRRECNGRTGFSSHHCTQRNIHTKSQDLPQNTLPAQSEVASPAEVKKFLTGNNISYSDGHTCIITSCPRHVKQKVRLKELDKLYINSTTGFFVCHSCKHSGSFHKLRENISDILCAMEKRKRKPGKCFADCEDAAVTQEKKKISDFWSQCIPVQNIPPDVLELLQEDLSIQNLSLKTLTKHDVRCSEDGRSLYMPLYGVDKELEGLKIYSIQNVQTSRRQIQRVVPSTMPRNNPKGVFGWHLVKESHTDVVLTSSEFDAMAVHQETGLPCLSLPKGDSMLPQEMLPLLEKFKKIILWLPGDMKSWENAKHFANKLGGSRCYLIRPGEGHPGPMECLRRSLSLRNMISSSRLLSHKSIVTFRNLRHEVFSELAHIEQVSGVKWRKYPMMNELLKGHRRGELTVFTGRTGAGKTTFISDYSLDLCEQGVNTLWGSFEVKNVRLMKTMLTQLAQQNLSKNLDEFNYWADKFEQLPMFFMTFHGQESITKVIETMSHAVYVHDIAHVVVDNLQFMMGLDSTNANDRFFRQDLMISSFRKFATQMNCHVTLVIHPRKEREEEDLTLSSIFGGARATQEADNVMILQDRRFSAPRGRKFIQVAKNRFDGELGVMLLKFDKESLSFSLKPKKKESSGKGADTPTSLHTMSSAPKIAFQDEMINNVSQTEYVQTLSPSANEAVECEMMNNISETEYARPVTVSEASRADFSGVSSDSDDNYGG